PAPIARHQRSSTQLTSLLINNAGALTGTVTRAAPATASAAALDTLVDALIKDCVGDAGPVTAPGATHEAHIALRYRSHDDGTGHLDIESIRDRHG
ncbi:hypothetical protein OQ722_24925, partial [Mycobacterium ulcerans]|nr:hypothetical protein [Mycobacterium ulcerans]MEB3911372.1 hypothetical protein [Mycobacterium ulcerans]MEB3921609.1 hypothetical protein [Mycobacterium ulcerans]MEB3925744.1 hypothetical protein [Mycobacterium ulcerans]MEB3929871.1 hypothetical protein [Mycobacterium ulcerans]